MDPNLGCWRWSLIRFLYSRFLSMYKGKSSDETKIRQTFRVRAKPVRLATGRTFHGDSGAYFEDIFRSEIF